MHVRHTSLQIYSNRFSRLWWWISTYNLILVSREAPEFSWQSRSKFSVVQARHFSSTCHRCHSMVKAPPSIKLTLALLYLLSTVWVQQHAQAAAFIADLCTPKNSAEKLFQYWNLRTANFLRSLQLEQQSWTSTGHEHESFQNGQLCLLKIKYDGLGHFTAKPPGTKGQAFCVKAQAYDIR